MGALPGILVLEAAGVYHAKFGTGGSVVLSAVAGIRKKLKHRDHRSGAGGTEKPGFTAEAAEKNGAEDFERRHRSSTKVGRENRDGDGFDYAYGDGGARRDARYGIVASEGR